MSAQLKLDLDHEPRKVPLPECRIDALLMALGDDDRAVDSHEPRIVEIEECRIVALLQQAEEVRA